MNNWKDILIEGSTTLLKAIEIMEMTASRIALVLDNNQSLVGTVMDGDIRRGMLKGISLHDPVHMVMNTNPTIAYNNEHRDLILQKMNQKRIHLIPVVDEKRRIIRLEVLDEIIPTNIHDNWVVLMAGGLGTRLRPLTDECPKPLLRIEDKPILETILENFIEHGFRRFYITLGYKAEMIQTYFGDGSKWGAEIRYTLENKRLGTAGALGLLPEKATKPFFVMNGDVLTKVNFRLLLDFHTEYQSKATMCIKEYYYQIPFGVVQQDQHHLLEIVEKPMHRFFVNAGIYVLDPSVMDEIPRDELYDMPELFAQLLKQNKQVTAFPIREYWLDIGQMDDFEKAKVEYKGVFG
jgi:dTDP-glucose pyrophosphorylase